MKKIKIFVMWMMLCLFLWNNQVFAGMCRTTETWWIINSIKYIFQADSILYGQAEIIETINMCEACKNEDSVCSCISQKSRFTAEKVYKWPSEITLSTTHITWTGWMDFSAGDYLQNWKYYLVLSKESSSGYYEPFFREDCSEISGVSQKIDPTLQMILYIYVYRYYLLVWVCGLVFYIINHKIRWKKKKEKIELNLENENK